jgi:hypothetical protein
MSRISENLRTLERLAEAFNQHDLDGIMELLKIVAIPETAVLPSRTAK